MNDKDIIECTITGIRPYGIFVEYKEYSGLVHISEISEFYIENINDIFAIGDKVTLFVLEVNEKYKRLKLSYKQNHKIHKRIRKNMKVVIGFHSLKNKLPIWLENEKNKGSNNDKNNE